jgi:hypothetical protein
VWRAETTDLPAPFFCRLTLRYQVVCPLAGRWGCPHEVAAPEAAERTRAASDRRATPPRTVETTAA